MKKVITVIVTLALCAGCFAGCTPTEQSEDARMLLFKRAHYAGMLQFDSFAGSFIRLYQAIEQSDYTDLVLVMSEAESAGYDESVLVAWPSEQTEEILHRLNLYVSLDDIDVTYYNLTYPVTMTDVVVNWQDVGNLLGSMDTIYDILKL